MRYRRRTGWTSIERRTTSMVQLADARGHNHERQGIEFIVDGIRPRRAILPCSAAVATLPIHVGEVFDAVYRYKRRRYPDELGDEPVREVEKPAAIRVVCIHAYERSLTIGEGMTGSLTLDGDGLQYIAPGWILGRKSESPVGRVSSASFGVCSDRENCSMTE